MNDEKNTEKILKELEDVKAELRAVKREAKTAREEASQTRDMLDSNVMSVYRKMAEKTNSLLLMYSSLACSVLLILTTCMIRAGADESTIYILLGFTIIATAVMIVSTVMLGVYTIRDIKVFIKNKQWKKKIDTKEDRYE